MYQIKNTLFVLAIITTMLSCGDKPKKEIGGLFIFKKIFLRQCKQRLAELFFEINF